MAISSNPKWQESEQLWLLGQVRPTVRAKQWVMDLFECIQRTRTFGLAAETAFWLFLSLLPLLAVAGFTAARLSLGKWHEVAPFVKTLPPAAQSLIGNELAKVSAWDGGTVGVLGVLTFLWLGSSGVHSIFDALEIESGAHRRWLPKRALALATCIGLSLSVALLAILGPGVEAALSDLGERMLGGAPLNESFATSGVVRGVLSFLILTGQTWCLFRIGIPKQVNASLPTLPGVLIAVVLQVLLSIAYTGYISTVGDGSAYTAGLTLVGLVLTALYLYVVALLIGATINRMLSPASPRCE